MNNKIVDRNVRLSLNESKYWRRFFTNNLKVGVELECCYRRGLNPISRMRDYLEPTEDYGKFGRCGVVTVKDDGSLDNGAEICTIGRRLDFLDLYYQYKYICEKMISIGASMNSRAGLHNHVLLDFGDEWDCLEKPVPGIIFKNFVQLMKMFPAELVWITSTVCQDDRGNTNLPVDQYGNWITRKPSFCMHRSLMACDANTDIPTFLQQLRQGGRYNFLNANAMHYTPNYNFDRFHFELRFPDGSMYPAQIAAQNMLWAAMLLKAIKLSEAGLIDLGDDHGTARSLINMIRGSEDGMRCSAPINEETMDIIRNRTLNMLLYFKPELDSFDIHIYPVLKVLAIQPVSIMRREMDDSHVNASFHALIENMYEGDMQDCDTLLEYITLQNMVGKRNENDWKEVACTDLSIPRGEIDKRLNKIGMKVNIKFDKTIGAYVIA